MTNYFPNNTEGQNDDNDLTASHAESTVDGVFRQVSGQEIISNKRSPTGGGDSILNGKEDGNSADMAVILMIV